MRLPDKNTYGPATDAFKAAMARSLSQGEEPIVKRKRVSMVLVTALLVLLFAACALAIADRAGLVDFFALWEAETGYTVPERFAHLDQGEGALLVAELDDLEIVVTEVVGDGIDYYFNTTVALKPGVEGMLVPLYGNDFPEGEVPTSPDGSPIYYITHEIRYNGSGAARADMLTNEDGSLSFFSDPAVVAMTDTVEMTCAIDYVKGESGTIPNADNFRNGEFAFTMRTAEALDTRRLVSPGIMLENTGIQIDELYFRQLSDVTFCRLYFRFPGGEAVNYLQPSPHTGIAIRLTDEDGQALADLGFEYQRNTYFQGGARLDLEMLPDTVILTVHDVVADRVLDSITLSLSPGAFDEARLARYEEPTSLAAKLRHTLPWDDWTPDMQYATTDLPAGQTAALYLDPRDPSTLIGEYYSGVGMENNVHYMDWTQVYLGGYGFGRVYGYMRIGDIRYGEDLAGIESGVRLAEIVPANGEYVEVRMEPSLDTVITSRIEPGTEVRVLGVIGEWRHVAFQAADGMSRIGYVHMDELHETNGTAPATLYNQYY